MGMALLYLRYDSALVMISDILKSQRVCSVYMVEILVKLRCTGF